MGTSPPFIDRVEQFNDVKGYELNRVVDFLNKITDGSLAFNLPTSSTATLPPTSYGTLALKFDEKTPTGASVTFNLPSGFTHVHFRGQARSATASNFEDLVIQFNGDTGANYAGQQFYGNNSGTVSSQDSALAANRAVGFIVGNTATANIGTTFSIDVENYSGSTFIKEAIGYCQTWGTLASVNEFLILRAVRWNSTAALTSITLLTGSGANFVSGTKISGYVWP